MRLNELHPELQMAFRFMPAFPLHNERFVRFSNWVLSRAPRRCSIGEVRITDWPLSNGSVRLYRPPGASSGAGLLWIHGGGMLTGSVALDDKLCARYARDLKLVVVSIQYRLAPENPYPAALDDCVEAWHWLLGHASELDVDPHRIAISGQSAGGGLAATLAQKLHDLGGIPPAGVALLCPMLDDRPAARRELDEKAHFVWNNRNNRAGWAAYLSQPPGSPSTPPYAVAARRRDLRGLPPTWLAVSDIDLLFDEGLRYHERLVACGVDSEVHLIPGAPHGFEALLPSSRLAQELFRANHRFLTERLNLEVRPNA